jgi:hypothetical protein
MQPNVINVYVNFIEVTKQVFHNFLQISGACETPIGRQLYLKLPKGINCVHFFSGLIQFKGIVLHGCIQFSKEGET